MLRLFFGTFTLIVIAIVIFEVSTIGTVGNLPQALLAAIESIVRFCSTFQIMS